MPTDGRGGDAVAAVCALPGLEKLELVRPGGLVAGDSTESGPLRIHRLFENMPEVQKDFLFLLFFLSCCGRDVLNGMRRRLMQPPIYPILLHRYSLPLTRHGLPTPAPTDSPPIFLDLSVVESAEGDP